MAKMSSLTTDAALGPILWTSLDATAFFLQKQPYKRLLSKRHLCTLHSLKVMWEGVLVLRTKRVWSEQNVTQKLGDKKCKVHLGTGVTRNSMREVRNKAGGLN